MSPQKRPVFKPRSRIGAGSFAGRPAGTPAERPVDTPISPPESLLTVVVPIYNEAQVLPDLLPGLVALVQERSWQLVLVDDGSTDATPELLAAYARTPRVRIASHKINRGYGGALKTGISLVETPFLVTIDGDGQHDLADIEKVFAFALEKDADLVVGAREAASRRLSYRGVGKWIIRNFARLLMPLPVSDLNSGFKLYRSDLAKRYIRACPSSMAFSDIITLIFINQRRLVLECPIRVQERRLGVSTISAYTAFETIIAIINMAVMFNPLRVFLPLAAFCILFGILWGGRILLLGRGVSVGSLLAVVVGLWFITIGFVAAQISAFRMELLEADEDRLG